MRFIDPAFTKVDFSCQWLRPAISRVHDKHAIVGNLDGHCSVEWHQNCLRFAS